MQERLGTQRYIYWKARGEIAECGMRAVNISSFCYHLQNKLMPFYILNQRGIYRKYYLILRLF